MIQALILILAYFIGSIPVGYLFVRLIRGEDLRKLGSGSTGATNVSRILGMKFFVIVSILDVLKGILAVWLASILMPDIFRDWFIVSAGLMAIFGHVYPVWLKFKGGKGVNTTLGVALFISPTALAIAIVVFIIVLVIGRYISAASLLAGIGFAIAVSVLQFKMGNPNIPYISFSIFVPLMFITTHRQNIMRLFRREEIPYGQKK